MRRKLQPILFAKSCLDEKQTNENVDKLLQWILSEEGQEIIEKTGYVGN